MALFFPLNREMRHIFPLIREMNRFRFPLISIFNSENPCFDSNKRAEFREREREENQRWVHKLITQKPCVYVCVLACVSVCVCLGVYVSMCGSLLCIIHGLCA